jgi:hypothetical protein
MKALVTFLAKNLVDAPDQVSVEEVSDDAGVRFTLKVAEEDKGKIIGKQGKVVKAIRAVLGIPAAKSDLKAALDLE